ncbi:MAG: ABC transporter permease [Phycisphaerales bacterium]|nr:MAG: ABC transporter permease [Phycisphaerales bacterium]
MGALWQDMRYGIRMLTKSPSFTIVAVLTLALGIAASTALFAVLKALVLDPFPFPESDRIVYVWNDVGWPLSTPDFKDIREQNRSFEEIGAFTHERYNLGLESPESVYGVRCTSGVLRTLGMAPLLGRWLEEDDESPGAEQVAVISHSLWSRCFAADPNVLGKSVRLNGRGTTVVGVMPASFEFPSVWYGGNDYELWVPLRFGSRSRGNYWLLGIGRLKENVSVQAADADLKIIGKRLARAYPDTNLHKPMVVHSLHWQMTRRMASGMRILFGAVTLLLLVACANVAGMLLARGTRRQGEFAVRLALGARRLTVVRLILAETLLLGLLASAAGVLLAVWGVDIVRNLIPPALVTGARRAAIRVDGTVLLFSIGLALLTSFASGLLPAVTTAYAPVRETLKEGGRSRTGSHLRYRFLRQLVAAQIAIAVVLANGAILLSGSYLNVFEANRRLDTQQVISAEIVLPGEQYDQERVRIQFWDQLSERIAALPGVRAVGVTTKLPLEGGTSRAILVDDEVYDPTARRTYVEESLITSGYFAAMGLALLSGRPPESQDASAESVGIVINRAMAEHFWAGENPVGKRVRPNSSEPQFNAHVLGVVEDTRQWNAEHAPRPEMYFPYAFWAHESANLIVRATGDAQVLTPMIRSELAALDRGLPLANVRTMKEVLQASNSGRRMSALLINTFMVTALILTAVGIYGTLSYHLLQRQRDIGIRIAMGALPGDVLNFVLRQAGVWVIAGLLIGMALAGVSSLILRSQVYGISPWHPLPLLLGLTAVGTAASLACLLPARHAAKIGPMEALRYE